MAIVATDIKKFYSGGSSNSDPLASIGGAKSSVEVVTLTLFDDVSAAEALAGDVEYRCIYIQNKHASLTLTAAKAFLQANTSSADTTIDIGVAAAGKNAVESAVANEGTAPAGVTFSAPANYAGGLALGNLAVDDYIGLWFRRTINAAAAVSADTAKLRVIGETAA